MSKRVVITGFGVLSPWGPGADLLLDGLLNKEHAVTPMPEPYAGMSPGFGAQVTATWRDLRSLPGARGLRPSTMSRFTFLAAGTMVQTLAETGFDPDEGDLHRRGLTVGTLCNTTRLEKYVRFMGLMSGDENLAEGRFVKDDRNLPEAMKLFSGFDIMRLMNNMPAAHCAIAARTRGVTNTYLGTPVAGMQAMGRAFRNIQDGLVDISFAGGVGSSTLELLMLTRGHRGQLCSADAEHGEAGRPFDAGATGRLPGEGGAFFILETPEHAAARGVEPICEVLGYADRFEAPPDLNSPPSAGATIRAAKAALEEAELSPADVDLLIPTGMSEAAVDRMEALAVSEVLGPARPDWFTPTAQIGFAEAGGNALGLAAGLAAVAAGTLPANRNSTDPIAEWPLETRSESTKTDAKTIWVNGVSAEGVSASLLLRAGA